MTDQCPTCSCDKDEPIKRIEDAVTQIQIDVAYTRGKMETIPVLENRVGSLESTARNQNIIGSVVAMALAGVAWFRGGS